MDCLSSNNYMPNAHSKTIHKSYKEHTFNLYELHIDEINVLNSIFMIIHFENQGNQISRS